MCRFCERHDQCGGYEVDCLSIRKRSKYDPNVYTGIHSFIDLDTNELVMYACVDSKDVKPLHADAAFDIFYCPICGRKLGEN
jgi:hypothetical protein